jgi:hypothetical protein
MQRYGQADERVFEPYILPDWVVSIKEALGCLAPQGFGNSKDQVV